MSSHEYIKHEPKVALALQHCCISQTESGVSQVPGVCSDEYRSRILNNFALPERPYPANEALLEGQRHDCGGIATRPPPQSPRSYPDSPVIRLSPLGPEAAAYANAGATFGWFNPLPVTTPELV